MRKRPHLDAFLEAVSELFEVVVFTASQQVYAERLLNMIDPQKKFVKCVFINRWSHDRFLVVASVVFWFGGGFSVAGGQYRKIIVALPRLVLTTECP